MSRDATCNYKSGPLPACAPLAVSMVPMQQGAEPRYDRAHALQRGTLFPGLDLPFRGIVNNKDVANTPLGEIMAIGFVIDELRLYLDTHPDDEDAFATLKELIALGKEAHRRYVAKCGPLDFADVGLAETYTWIEDPWPWVYTAKGGR